MKNLVFITFLSLAITAFIACGSDGNAQNAQTTAAAATDQVAEAITDSGASTSELAKEMVEPGKADPKETVVSESASGKEASITKKVKNAVGKASSDAAVTAKEKVAATKEAMTHVEQKQRPSVQDVEINNPSRPSPPKPAINTPKKDNSTIEAGTEKTKPATQTGGIQANEIHQHADWNALLSKHVSAAGKVNYKGLKTDVAKLDQYLKDLADHPIESSWSREDKMAYWINAYNAFTVKLILDNYPLKSITDLENGKPWDKKWMKLGGKTYSLNNIENDILRPTYKDARIHFAVNCAAKSCPPLLNKAWTGKNLESNFERQAKAFINNPTYNKVSENNIEISKIFDWYAVDFGNIVEYINKYAAKKASSSAKVEYKEYDWSLNE